MKNTYQPASRSARTLAAVAAIATVVALFDFVSGLGDSQADVLAQVRAASHAPQVASAGTPNAQTLVAQ